MFAPLLHHLILIMVLYAQQLFKSCHFRDQKSLGEPFKITELQNKSQSYKILQVP